MKLTHVINALVIVLTSVAVAQAQSDRTFVSTHGSDNTDCGLLDLPCRSFNTALTKTNAGGEVIALDSGIYDSFNITISRSVTMTAVPGAHVELSNSDNVSNRVTINTPADGRVVLRNLYLSTQPGNGAGAYGIGVIRVGVLQVENCVIDGFSEGIDFGVSNAVQASIKDTVIRNSISNGMAFFSSSGLIKATVDNCHFDNNGSAGIFDGLAIVRAARVTVRNSVATGNTGAGFSALAGDLNLENCEASNNLDGIAVQGSANNNGTVTVSNCIVTNNSQFGFVQRTSGVFNSLGNNVVRRNGTNSSGTINTISGT